MRPLEAMKRHGARAGVMAAASLVLAVAVAGAAGAAEPAAKPNRVTLRAQLGIIYAQNGQVEEARKEFVKLLEEPTGRAAALSNLGNLAMLDGHVDVAIENYVQAAALDTTDGGILLNLGIAHKQLGHDDEAVEAISRALTRTGGTERAEYLLGIRTVGEPSKGKASKLSNEEIRAMLAKAKARVPDATAAANGAQKAKATPVVSRPGGARAADVSVGATSLYWKEK
jgi:prepilin-type processing-associated H-X9-DG protein